MHFKRFLNFERDKNIYIGQEGLKPIRYEKETFKKKDIHASGLFIQTKVYIHKGKCFNIETDDIFKIYILDKFLLHHEINYDADGLKKF